MTLEEAIKHAIEVAELNEECTRIYNEHGKTMESYTCKECASEHRQLAEWLKELKAYRGSHVLQRWLKQCDSCKHRHKLASEAPCSSCCHTFMNKHEEVKADANSD